MFDLRFVLLTLCAPRSLCRMESVRAASDAVASSFVLFICFKNKEGGRTKDKKTEMGREGKGRKKSIFRPQALECLIREFYFHLITPKETWPEMTQRAEMLLIT